MISLHHQFSGFQMIKNLKESLVPSKLNQKPATGSRHNLKTATSLRAISFKGPFAFMLRNL